MSESESTFQRHPLPSYFTYVSIIQLKTSVFFLHDLLTLFYPSNTSFPPSVSIVGYFSHSQPHPLDKVNSTQNIAQSARAAARSLQVSRIVL